MPSHLLTRFQQLEEFSGDVPVETSPDLSRGLAFSGNLLTDNVAFLALGLTEGTPGFLEMRSLESIGVNRTRAPASERLVCCDVIAGIDPDVAHVNSGTQYHRVMVIARWEGIHHE